MSDETRVLYNAECPVCSFEIDHYAKYAGDKALPLRFEDLNAGELGDWGVTADEAARRLYVLKDGQLLSGVPAFILLWKEMPRYRWLARLVSVPGVHWLTVQLYERVAAPLIYRSHVRRQARQATNC